MLIIQEATRGDISELHSAIAPTAVYNGIAVVRRIITVHTLQYHHIGVLQLSYGTSPA